MPRVGPIVAMHSLNMCPECKSMKQRKRKMNEDKTVASIAETEKLLEVGFIKDSIH